VGGEAADAAEVAEEEHVGGLCRGVERSPYMCERRGVECGWETRWVGRGYGGRVCQEIGGGAWGITRGTGGLGVGAVGVGDLEDFVDVMRWRFRLVECWRRWEGYGLMSGDGRNYSGFVGEYCAVRDACGSSDLLGLEMRVLIC
jgi:hypothetical protein